MAKPYILQKGDTLAKVAEQLLGDRKLARALADYNGLRDAKRIVAGQVTQIPTALEQRPARVVPSGACAAGAAQTACKERGTRADC